MQYYLKRNIQEIFKKGDIVRAARESGGLIQIFDDSKNTEAWVVRGDLEPIHPEPIQGEPEKPQPSWPEFRAYMVEKVKIKVDSDPDWNALKELQPGTYPTLVDRFSHCVGIAMSPPEAAAQCLFNLATATTTPTVLARIAWYMIMAEVERETVYMLVAPRHVLADTYVFLYDTAHDWLNQFEGDGQS